MSDNLLMNQFPGSRKPGTVYLVYVMMVNPDSFLILDTFSKLAIL